jgi:predicted chitinase
LLPAASKYGYVTASMLNEAMSQGNIKTKAQIIHFLAQISHESTDFTRMNELGPKN